MKIDDIIGMATDACRNAGAREWEVYYLETERFTAEAKDAELEAMETSRGRGLAARVRLDERLGFSYSADLGKEALARAAKAAVEGALAADPDPERAFGNADDKSPELELCDKRFSEVDQSEKIARAIAVEATARSVDKRISTVRQAAYGEVMRRVRVVNHLGLDREGAATLCSASVMAVARENEESQSGWDVDHSATWDGLNYEAVGRRAATDAVELLGAQVVPTQKAPMVLRNNAACQVLEVLGESFSGEAVAKGKSMLAGKTGKKIFSEIISVIDDGRLDNGMATFPFDGEGVSRRATALVEKGVLKNFLYDLAWARKAGTKSTGNAGRGGYTSPPRPEITNLFIRPNNGNFREMSADMGTGLFVTELMGVHTANPVTGDFSVGALGWWIKNGKKAHPVQGVTIAGNIIKLLAEVDAVADDIRFVGQVGSPSLRVPRIDISGD